MEDSERRSDCLAGLCNVQRLHLDAGALFSGVGLLTRNFSVEYLYVVRKKASLRAPLYVCYKVVELTLSEHRSSASVPVPFDVILLYCHVQILLEQFHIL